jgi:hypothetical protein
MKILLSKRSTSQAEKLRQRVKRKILSYYRILILLVTIKRRTQRLRKNSILPSALLMRHHFLMMKLQIPYQRLNNEF